MRSQIIRECLPCQYKAVNKGSGSFLVAGDCDLTVITFAKAEAERRGWAEFTLESMCDNSKCRIPASRVFLPIGDRRVSRGDRRVGK